MSSRNIRLFLARWKVLIFACCVTYLFVFYVPYSRKNNDNFESVRATNEILSENDEHEELKQQNEEIPGKQYFEFNPVGKEPFSVEEVLTKSEIKLAERMQCDNQPGKKKVILSWNAGHSSENLNGCADWNCEFTQDRSRMAEADAVLLAHQDPEFKRRSPDQILVYFSQESPVNSGFNVPSMSYFNMSLGFRHDTPAGSPYGYTVKLGPKSRKTGAVIDEGLVQKKTKGAAWYVSHCSTNSRRESIVKEIQKYFTVDIYGGCGPLKCPRNGGCENMLDVDYHFYVAFENSICKDYNTEKLWRQGFQRTIIPLVLKRSIVEDYVPPNSFIAVDDFPTIKEFSDHLNYLVANKTAYMEYFDWRRDYKVIFLDGTHHDVLERPWGFCQVCRVAWQNAKKHYVIEDWHKWWTSSCETDGELANKLLNTK